MKIARNLYEFVTGGSIASPIGLAGAALAGYLFVAHGAGAVAGFVLLATLAATLVASVLEGAR